jgi:hypothetical protein
LNFTEIDETDEVVYDIEIEMKEKRKNRLKAKMSPEVRLGTSSDIFLRDFGTNSGFYTNEKGIEVRVSLRKMHYNEEMHYFDNEVLLEKVIIVNPSGDQLKMEKCLFLQVESESYQGLTLDFYDDNIKKRLKYYI